MASFFLSSRETPLFNMNTTPYMSGAKHWVMTSQHPRDDFRDIQINEAFLST